MALPKCPNQNCPSNKTAGRTFFEFFEDTPSGSRYSLYLIQCTKCGTVIGYKDTKHVPDYVMKIKDSVDEILTKIQTYPYNTSLSSEIDNIKQDISRILFLLQNK